MRLTFIFMHHRSLLSGIWTSVWQKISLVFCHFENSDCTRSFKVQENTLINIEHYKMDDRPAESLRCAIIHMWANAVYNTVLWAQHRMKTSVLSFRIARPKFCLRKFYHKPNHAVRVKNWIRDYIYKHITFLLQVIGKCQLSHTLTTSLISHACTLTFKTSQPSMRWRYEILVSQEHLVFLQNIFYHPL